LSHEHHAHAHSHGHAPDYGRVFLVGAAINLAYVAVEAGCGLASGSLALLADAGHNLADILALGLAWAASALGRRARERRATLLAQ